MTVKRVTFLSYRAYRSLLLFTIQINLSTFMVDCITNRELGKVFCKRKKELMKVRIKNKGIKFSKIKFQFFAASLFCSSAAQVASDCAESSIVNVDCTQNKFILEINQTCFAQEMVRNNKKVLSEKIFFILKKALESRKHIY